MKYERPTTYSIDVHHRFIGYLKQHIDKLNGTLFKARPVDEIIKYLKTISDAEAAMWEQIRQAYPETLALGAKDLTVSSTKVTWEDDIEDTPTH